MKIATVLLLSLFCALPGRAQPPASPGTRLPPATTPGRGQLPSPGTAAPAGTPSTADAAQDRIRDLTQRVQQLERDPKKDTGMTPTLITAAVALIVALLGIIG